MKDKQQITNELFNAQYELNSAKLRYIGLGQREMLSSEGIKVREKIIRLQERIEILTWVLGFEDEEETK